MSITYCECVFVCVAVLKKFKIKIYRTIILSLFCMDMKLGR